MADNTISSVEKDTQPVVRQLVQESHTAMSEEDVGRLYSEEYSRLSKDARVTGYLHLLTYRAVMQRLRYAVPEGRPH